MSIIFNDYGQKTSTKVGDIPLATYSYSAATHNMSGITYGNGDAVSYTYDTLYRIKTVSYNDIGVVVVTYTYDYLGNKNWTTPMATWAILYRQKYR